MAHTIAIWRTHAIAIVTGQVDASNSQQALAWRFLRQHGVK
ncbi:hypothetical protein [Paramagnetospirillum kuznetsovii]|nr:hypothetical protein [Paramagnetospirillum kuznetsovii]